MISIDIYKLGSLFALQEKSIDSSGQVNAVFVKGSRLNTFLFASWAYFTYDSFWGRRDSIAGKDFALHAIDLPISGIP